LAAICLYNGILAVFDISNWSGEAKNNAIASAALTLGVAILFGLIAVVLFKNLKRNSRKTSENNPK